MIHPTALIDKTAYIHKTATIGPYAVIGRGVRIGAGTRIGAHAVIGGPPEHREHWDDWQYSVRIGADCFINHFVTIDSGTEKDTVVESDCTLLRCSHVGHDANIERGVTLSCNVLIGGHAIIMRAANCGLGSIVHQGCVVGPICMIGMGSVVTKKSKILPFWTYAGNPVRPLGRNSIGVERSGYDNPSLIELEREYYKIVMGIDDKLS